MTSAIPHFMSGGVAAATAGSAYRGISPFAYDYDGTNDYATRGADLTGMADGKQGTLSVWVRIDGGDGANRLVIGNGATAAANRFALLLTTANVFQVSAGTAAGAGLLDIRSSAYTAGATWLHVLASWKLDTVGARHIYVTDVSDLAVTTFTDGTIDYTLSDWGVGALPDASLKWNGCISELFFHPVYIDLSVEANRRKFITAAGKPAFLGANGSTPLGVQPLLYSPTGDPSASQLGSGGLFSLTGALGVASTSPFDQLAVHVTPSLLNDNGYSTSRTSYYESSAFARLVVNTNATSATVRFFSNATVFGGVPDLCRVGIWDGTTKQEVAATAAGLNRGTVNLAAGTKDVQFIAGYTDELAGLVEGSYLVGVTLHGGTFASPQTTSTASRMVIWGDSISVGANASAPTNNSWTMKLRALRAPSSTMSEGWGHRSLFDDGPDASSRQALVDRIAGYSPSIVWLAIGTNDYGLDGGLWSAASFQTAYADLLVKLNAALPSAAIYAQSPVDRATETANANFSNTLGAYRTAISNACSGKAYVTFVDGTAFLNPATDLDADGIHPDTDGHTLIYEAVATQLGLTP